MQIANDWTPPSPRPLTALERAARSVEFVAHRIMERGRLTPEQREARAAEYDASAKRLAGSGDEHPINLEMAGLRATAAAILRARD
jgi:hypothetical protein